MLELMVEQVWLLEFHIVIIQIKLIKSNNQIIKTGHHPVAEKHTIYSNF